MEKIEQSEEDGFRYQQTWTVGNKLESVTWGDRGWTCKVAFGYDGDGQRLWKREYLPRPLGVVVRLTLYAGYGFEEEFVEALVRHEAGEMVVPGDVCGKGVGVTERGFTGQREEIGFGLYDFNARYLSPGLGRFISPDTIVPDHANPQHLNRYSYVYNNPLRYTDPSGHEGEAWQVVQSLLLRTANVVHSINANRDALVTTQGMLIDATPVIGDAKGFIEVFTGYDIRTGEDLGNWRYLGLIAMSELRTLRHADEVAGVAGHYADDVADALGIFCSFSANTPVLTKEGLKPISTLQKGELVWAYNETTDKTGYYPIVAILKHLDEVTLYLTINGEVIETTPEHPFKTDDDWVAAGELRVGDLIRGAEGGYGMVDALVVEDEPQVMYNLTVGEAHTFFVGDGEWLVHNQCDTTILLGHTEMLETFIDYIPGVSYLANNLDRWWGVGLLRNKMASLSTDPMGQSGAAIDAATHINFIIDGVGSDTGRFMTNWEMDEIIRRGYADKLSLWRGSRELSEQETQEWIQNWITLRNLE